MDEGVELTVSETAEFLNVSQQYLVRLCEAGELPFRMDGAERVFLLEDVLAYRDFRDAERRRRFREHFRSAAAAGEYDNPEEWVLP